MANESALTEAQIGLVDPINSRVKSYIAGAAITKGEAVAQATDGKIHPADASTSGGYLFEQVKGIALNAGGAGQAIDVLWDGEVYGYTVSGLNCGDLIYLSDTEGRLSTVLGTGDVWMGRVTCLADKNLTKVAHIQIIYAEAKASE